MENPEFATMVRKAARMRKFLRIFTMALITTTVALAIPMFLFPEKVWVMVWGTTVIGLLVAIFVTWLVVLQHHKRIFP